MKEDRQEAQKLIHNPPSDLRKEVRLMGEQIRQAGRLRYEPSRILGLEDLPKGSVISDELFMRCWLSLYRYGKTWKQLVQEREKGSWKAAKQLLSLEWDYQRWRFGKLRPNEMRFKINRDHFTLMITGLNFGLDKLTAEQLADCFNELCICSKAHDPELLAKLRRRIKRMIAKKSNTK